MAFSVSSLNPCASSRGGYSPLSASDEDAPLTRAQLLKKAGMCVARPIALPFVKTHQLINRHTNNNNWSFLWYSRGGTPAADPRQAGARIRSSARAVGNGTTGTEDKSTEEGKIDAYRSQRREKGSAALDKRIERAREAKIAKYKRDNPGYKEAIDAYKESNADWKNAAEFYAKGDTNRSDDDNIILCLIPKEQEQKSEEGYEDLAKEVFNDIVGQDFNKFSSDKQIKNVFTNCSDQDSNALRNLIDQDNFLKVDDIAELKTPSIHNTRAKKLLEQSGFKEKEKDYLLRVLTRVTENDAGQAHDVLWLLKNRNLVDWMHKGCDINQEVENYLKPTVEGADSARVDSLVQSLMNKRSFERLSPEEIKTFKKKLYKHLSRAHDQAWQAVQVLLGHTGGPDLLKHVMSGGASISQGQMEVMMAYFGLWAKFEHELAAVNHLDEEQLKLMAKYSYLTNYAGKADEVQAGKVKQAEAGKLEEADDPFLLTDLLSDHLAKQYNEVNAVNEALRELTNSNPWARGSVKDKTKQLLAVLNVACSDGLDSLDEPSACVECPKDINNDNRLEKLLGFLSSIHQQLDENDTGKKTAIREAIDKLKIIKTKQNDYSRLLKEENERTKNLLLALNVSRNGIVDKAQQEQINKAVGNLKSWKTGHVSVSRPEQPSGPRTWADFRGHCVKRCLSPFKSLAPWHNYSPLDASLDGMTFQEGPSREWRGLMPALDKVINWVNPSPDTLPEGTLDEKIPKYSDRQTNYEKLAENLVLTAVLKHWKGLGARNSLRNQVYQSTDKLNPHFEKFFNEGIEAIKSGLVQSFDGQIDQTQLDKALGYAKTKILDTVKKEGRGYLTIECLMKWAENAEVPEDSLKGLFDQISKDAFTVKSKLDSPRKRLLRHYVPFIGRGVGNQEASAKVKAWSQVEARRIETRNQFIEAVGHMHLVGSVKLAASGSLGVDTGPITALISWIASKTFLRARLDASAIHNRTTGVEAKFAPRRFDLTISSLTSNTVGIGAAFHAGPSLPKYFKVGAGASGKLSHEHAVVSSLAIALDRNQDLLPKDPALEKRAQELTRFVVEYDGADEEFIQKLQEHQAKYVHKHYPPQEWIAEINRLSVNLILTDYKSGARIGGSLLVGASWTGGGHNTLTAGLSAGATYEPNAVTTTRETNHARNRIYRFWNEKRLALFVGLGWTTLGNGNVDKSSGIDAGLSGAAPIAGRAIQRSFTDAKKYNIAITNNKVINDSWLDKDHATLRGQYKSWLRGYSIALVKKLAFGALDGVLGSAKTGGLFNSVAEDYDRNIECFYQKALTTQNNLHKDISERIEKLKGQLDGLGKGSPQRSFIQGKIVELEESIKIKITKEFIEERFKDFLITAYAEKRPTQSYKELQDMNTEVTLTLNYVIGLKELAEEELAQALPQNKAKAKQRVDNLEKAITTLSRTDSNYHPSLIFPVEKAYQYETVGMSLLLSWFRTHTASSTFCPEYMA